MSERNKKNRYWQFSKEIDRCIGHCCQKQEWRQQRRNEGRCHQCSRCWKKRRNEGRCHQCSEIWDALHQLLTTGLGLIKITKVLLENVVLIWMMNKKKLFMSNKKKFINKYLFQNDSLQYKNQNIGTISWVFSYKFSKFGKFQLPHVFPDAELKSRFKDDANSKAKEKTQTMTSIATLGQKKLFSIFCRWNPLFYIFVLLLYILLKIWRSWGILQHYSKNFFSNTVPLEKINFSFSSNK